MRKYSIVGLSLLAVSAVTAAFAPSKASESKFALDGIFGASTITGGADVTCRERVSGDPAANCSWTDTAAVNNGAGSSTSGLAINSHSVTESQEGPAGATYSESLTTAQGVE